MRQIKSLVLRIGFAGILGVSACGQSAETKSVCQLSGRWNQTSADVATVLRELGSLPAGQIRDTMLEVVSNLQPSARSHPVKSGTMLNCS